MFNLGIKIATRVNRLRYPGPGALWSWSIVFRDAPDVIWHIVRRTGNLKRWGSAL